MPYKKAFLMKTEKFLKNIKIKVLIKIILALPYKQFPGTVYKDIICNEFN